MAKAKPLPFVPFDTGTFIAAQQRNIDAFASAGQIVVDGVKDDCPAPGRDDAVLGRPADRA